MQVRVVALGLCLLFAGLSALGQVGNGTITGSITDPAGAVVPGAPVEATNAETGVAFTGATSNAGIYTISGLPVGAYTVTVAVTGFKSYTHTNLALHAEQVVRENIALEVGAATGSATVTAEASLLKTETGELAYNVSIDQLDELPLLGIGAINAGPAGYRNPYNTLLTLPGISSYVLNSTFVLNGLGGTSTPEAMRVEGLDATSRVLGIVDNTEITQPSADAIQEVAYQASNYSPEYGTAGSVLINMSMKAGTNQYHGSGYDYFVNEDLNAGDPFTISGGPGSATGGDLGKYRPHNRRNDFGGTLGGPVIIPKLYNGHNKTFFFFNYEEFLETTQYSFIDTVPAAPYLTGNFSAISPNGKCNLCSAYGIPATALGGGELDALGRPMYANEIYDPLSRGVVASSNLGFANPFPNNWIPMARFDPVSVKIQALIQQLGATAQTSSLAGNYDGRIQGGRYSVIPSVKIDHNIDAKDKISFYYSENNTQSQVSPPSADGLPLEIGAYRGQFVTTYTERLNYDRSLRPTLLLHLGAGMLHTSYLDHAPFLNFDPAEYGLSGFQHDRQFPSFTGMNYPLINSGGVSASAYGGMQNIGTAGQVQTLEYEEKPSFNANVTWVRGKHTYKAGAELYLENIYNDVFSGVTLTATSGFSQGATAQPFTPTNSFNGFTQGFGYANFLLGDYTSTSQTSQTDPRYENQQWALFIQDSWKVNRKLTLDYGLRWDLSTVNREEYGRLAQLNPTGANTNAGGHPGNYEYASSCNCPFYKSDYPYAIAPRIGIAYQIDPKTVFRAGWGLTYDYVSANAGSTVATNGAYPLSGINPYVNDQTPGFIPTPVWPVTDPNIYPTPGTVGNGPLVPDANQNRPPRINQYSAGFQREITRSFVMEASYVGNHAVWLAGPLGELSQISPSEYASFGLYPYPGTGPCSTGGGVCANSTYNNNSADRALLGQPISSTAVIQKMASVGITNLLPYSGFPTSSPLASIMYPFPQFGAIEPTGSATGSSKYDSLQVKATKRLSHNLQAGGAYTWGQGFTRAAPQDFFNPQGDVWSLQQIPPQTLTFNAIYTVPKSSFLPKYANAVTEGWRIGWFADYQSGAFLTPPTSNVNMNFLTSEDIRVAGKSLYNVNINNLSSYNPYTTQVLNPNAWEPCPANSTCMAAGNYIKSFRAPRTPTENANIGRNFRIKERMNLQIRGEFVNIFNRTLMPAPMTTNPQNPLTHGGAAGQLTAGYGVIDTYLTPNTAYSGVTPNLLQGRTGTLIARFSF